MSESIEVRAKQMGWVPQEEFRGPAEKWTSAEEFVERGEAIMPILKANNQRLSEQLAAATSKTAELEARLAETISSISDMEQSYTEIVKQRVAATRKELIEGIKEARGDDDVEKEVELQSQLAKLETADAKAKEKEAPKQEASPVDYTKEPTFVAWIAENPWFGKDIRRTAYASGVAQELTANEGLKGKALLDRVSEEVGKIFDKPPVDRTESAGGGTSRAAPKGKGYESLPPDAKAQCDADAKKFVGPGKRYKDNAAWRTKYAEIYFAGDE